MFLGSSMSLYLSGVNEKFTSTKIPRTTATAKIKENISITYKNVNMYKFSYSQLVPIKERERKGEGISSLLSIPLSINGWIAGSQ